MSTHKEYRRCMECKKNIEVKENGRGVLFYTDFFRVYWIHKGKCLREYTKKWLTGCEAKKRGYVLGFCYLCEKPVRTGDIYIANRVSPQCHWSANEENMFFTTFPSREDIGFQHRECFDKRGQPSPITIFVR